MSQWDKMSILGHFVNDYPNCGVRVGFGQPFDEIQTDCVPRSFWNWEWLKRTWSFHMFNFRLLADGTSLHIVVDRLLQMWPGKQIFDTMISALDARVPTNAATVQSLNDMILSQ